MTDARAVPEVVVRGGASLFTQPTTRKTTNMNNFDQGADGTLPPPSWFPMHIGEEVMEVKDLSIETRGALYSLALDYFYKGGLPNNDRMVQKIAGVPARKWRTVYRELQTIFTPGWRHPRWDRILADMMGCVTVS